MLLDTEETTAVEIKIPRESLLEALGAVNKFIPSKPNPAELVGVVIYITADQSQVFLRTSNGVISSQVLLDLASYEGPHPDGEQLIIVPGKVLQAVVAGYPAGEVTLRVGEDDTFHVVSGKLDYTLQMLEPDNYPKLPVAADLALDDAVAVPSDDLLPSLTFTAKAAARDTNKPNLQTVHAAPSADSPDVAVFTATDTLQMIRYSANGIGSGLPADGIALPLPFVEAAAALIPVGEEVYLIADDHGFMLASDDDSVRLHCRGFQQKFPDVSGVLAALTGEYVVECDREELAGTLRRMRAYAVTDNQRVAFYFNEEDPDTLVGRTFNVSIKSSDGEAEEDVAFDVPQDAKQPEGEFGFKLTTLSDGIALFDTEKVRFHITSDSKPVRVTAPGHTATYMISLSR